MIHPPARDLGRAAAIYFLLGVTGVALGPYMFHRTFASAATGAGFYLYFGASLLVLTAGVLHLALAYGLTLGYVESVERVNDHATIAIRSARLNTNYRSVRVLRVGFVHLTKSGPIGYVVFRIGWRPFLVLKKNFQIGLE